MGFRCIDGRVWRSANPRANRLNIALLWCTLHQAVYRGAMTSTPPSPPVRGRLRQCAQIIVNAPPEWLEELDTAVLGANPAIAADPDLAGAVSRSNQANLYFWSTANVRDPGAPVPDR